MLGAVAFLIAALVWWALPGADSSARADETEAAGGGSARSRATHERPLPDMRELDQWLEQKAQSQQTAMPSEARLA